MVRVMGELRAVGCLDSAYGCHACVCVLCMTAHTGIGPAANNASLHSQQGALARLAEKLYEDGCWMQMHG